MTRILLILAIALFCSTPMQAEAQQAGSPPQGARGALGFAYSSNLAPDDGGPMRWLDYPLVRHVYSQSPAREAGLQVGDQVLRVNDRDGTEATAYHYPRVGDRWTLVVQRGTREVEVSFVIGPQTWPADEFVPPGTSARPNG